MEFIHHDHGILGRLSHTSCHLEPSRRSRLHPVQNLTLQLCIRYWNVSLFLRLARASLLFAKTMWPKPSQAVIPPCISIRKHPWSGILGEKKKLVKCFEKQKDSKRSLIHWFIPQIPTKPLHAGARSPRCPTRGGRNSLPELCRVCKRRNLESQDGPRHSSVGHKHLNCLDKHLLRQRGLSSWQSKAGGSRTGQKGPPTVP